MDTPKPGEPPRAAELPTEAVEGLVQSLRSGRGTPAPRISFTLVRELGPPLVRPVAVAFGPGGAAFILDRPDAHSFRLNGYPPDSPTGRVTATFQRGDDDGQLLGPVGLAVDAEGLVTIADAEGNGVKRFGPDGSWLATFSQAGFEGSPLSSPRDVALDAAGNLYIADTNNDRIIKLLPDGELAWALDCFTDADGAADELYEPSSVCVAGGRVYVADTNENRVLVFDDRRRLLATFADGLSFPSCVRCSRDGKAVHVADQGGLRVRRFGAGRPGELRLSEKLDSGSGLSGGSSMDVDAAGRVLMVHPQRETVVLVGYVEPC